MPDTGAPWNLPYPSPSDLVRDAPQAFEDLAVATAAGLDAAGPDTIERTGTDSTKILVGDGGGVSVADDTSPSPIVRPLPFGLASGTVTSSSSVDTTVTLPSGLFTSTPVMLGNVQNNVNLRGVIFTSVSSSSFVVNVRDQSGTRQASTVGWAALQLTP